MSALLPPGLSRRHFLAGSGVVAGAAVIGACGGGKKATTTSSKYVLAPFFGSGQFAAGSTIRAPFGVSDDQGSLLPNTSPPKIDLVVFGPDNKQVGRTLTVTRRSKGLPRPYYPLEVAIATQGIYTVRAKGGVLDGNSMSIEVSDPKDLGLIRPGLPLPPLQTPTVTDPHGVNPICTRTPTMCPLHDVTLAQALTEGKPVGLIVSTPHFCKVAICGPVLELVIAAAARHPGIKLLHAEVYADPYNDPDISRGGGRLSPTLNALGLPFEPALIIAGRDGKVTQRLDSIWDADELDAALTKATA